MSNKSDSEIVKITIDIHKEIFLKLKNISVLTGEPINDIVNEGLENYTAQIEKDILNRDLEEGYKANYDYYLKSQNEWRHVL